MTQIEFGHSFKFCHYLSFCHILCFVTPCVLSKFRFLTISVSSQFVFHHNLPNGVLTQYVVCQKCWVITIRVLSYLCLITMCALSQFFFFFKHTFFLHNLCFITICASLPFVFHQIWVSSQLVFHHNLCFLTYCREVGRGGFSQGVTTDQPMGD